jgi:hypothetical protein
MEIRMDIGYFGETNEKYDHHMIQLYHFWLYTQRNQRQHTIEIPAHCVYSSTVHNSQVMESAHEPFNR